jgi:hypothetical protein
MYGAASGEHIAKMAARSNAWDQVGAQTLKGLSRPLSQFAAAMGWGQASADRYSEVQLDGGLPLSPVRAREEIGRNLDQGTCWFALEGPNPREFPAVGVLTPQPAGTGALGRVNAQEPRPVGPAHCFGEGNNGRRNGRWADSLRRRLEYLPRVKLRRVNPKSAAGVKQNRHGTEGSKPSRGQPNPEGGT